MDARRRTAAKRLALWTGAALIGLAAAGAALAQVEPAPTLAEESHFLKADEGRKLVAGGAQTRIKADVPAGAERGFAVAVAVVPAGFVGPPRHFHKTSDELTYVLEGRMDFEIGGERHWVNAGEVAYAPRGTPHRVWGPGDKPAKVINVMGPPQLAAMRELAPVSANMGISDPKAAGEILAKHDIYWAPPLEGWMGQPRTKENMEK